VIERDTLLKWLDQTLEPGRINDYCPNGLQVQGKKEIRHIVTGVTASLALINKAIDMQADAILVHHGYFWKNEDPTIRGTRYERIKQLIKHDINLFAYHLPLDIHPILGNNARLGLTLGLKPMLDETGQPRTCGSNGLIWLGMTTPEDMSISELATHIETRLGRQPIVVSGAENAKAGVVAWCTGGAQSMFETALAAGAQTYITGEISEPCAHLARETGTTFISAGHHATERYGIEALGQALSLALDVDVTFVDIDNPA